MVQEALNRPMGLIPAGARPRWQGDPGARSSPNAPGANLDPEPTGLRIKEAGPATVLRTRTPSPPDRRRHNFVKLHAL